MIAARTNITYIIYMNVNKHKKIFCIVQYLFFSSYINHKPQTIYTTNYKVRVTAISRYQKNLRRV